MKNTLIIISASIALHSAAAQSVITNSWDVDVLDPVAYITDIWRGETIPLTARTGVSNIADSATFYWQEDGMGSAWWSTNATVSAGGDVTALWTPAMDSGAAAYPFFFRVGTIYRPFGTIKMRGSPGANPNAIPLPIRTIDFDAITSLNPPWATPADVAGAIGEIPALDLTPYLRTDISQEVVEGWSLKLLGYGNIYNFGELRQVGLDVSASDAFASYRAGNILVGPNSWSPMRKITLPYSVGTMALLSDISAATNAEAILRSAGDSAGSNYVASATAGMLTSSALDPYATSNWVSSIRGIHADIATNVTYHVVVSNGHWLIQEVQ